ncbi:MAG: 2-oxo acid dehydrogenase subunit E2 [Chlamydiae bacterium]|nr:2-oxo acid dehydrogenase subunit E2 [Chlamydiota bacterium]
MQEEFPIVLPKLGESIVSATIVQWFKKEGDYVQLDEPLLEVSTDKVNSEIPSPVAGVVKKILALPDEEKQVGEWLAVIEKTGETSSTEHKVEPIRAAPSCAQSSGEYKDFLSPAVLRLASELKISLDQVQKIRGTGTGGRVTKQDVEDFAKAKTKAPCPLQKSVGGEERLKMTGMRKAIAENMVKSFYEAPHATLVHEVDLTNVLKEVKDKKEDVQARFGAKLTVTSYIIHALCLTLAEYPLLNASLDQDTIVLKKHIHMGMAVNVDQGLLVPVIRQCQNLTLPQVALAVQELSTKARNNKLQPDDVAEGTFTVTNFGMSGVLLGIPIIRHPEVAILGIGAIKKRVQVLEGDLLGIRSMVHLSLTFDHRVIDGMYGCSFLTSLQQKLEQGSFLT